ncbi:hypothetical protein H8S37_04425 [Mediterraneibacter sp. NSJ-55]|uniref:Uncharacterized protein n=1 Tax=Mediterraneibacter hominis TaxID=2763054 RepID=A0A923LHL7_9FIRM|nr:hypothetical protein [Mediterraneibacter hominis]MBC5688179.1 hypothetical protein [Mediterraneibacter hominis]
MWDFLRKEMKGFTINEMAGYLENYGFIIKTQTKRCISAIDKYGFLEFFFCTK